MSLLDLILILLLLLAIAVAVGKHLAWNSLQSNFDSYANLYGDLVERCATVCEAQAQRKRVSTPSDMKKANLALDRAIEELI